MQWQALIANLAVVALLVAVWTHAEVWLEARPRRLRNLIFGTMMGIGAVASMLLSVDEGGIRYDLRSPLIALAGLFGGPWGALVAAGLATLARSAVGGAVPLGIFGIAVTTAIGVVGHAVVLGRDPTRTQVLLFSVLVGVGSLSGLLLMPAAVASGLFLGYGLPIAILTVASTAVFGLVILGARRQAHERDLLRTAHVQSPDLRFVKNAQGQFIRASQKLAELSGLRQAADLVGKTYFDIAPPELASVIDAREQEVLRSGIPMRDIEEHYDVGEGRELWFSTTLVPLDNRAGERIGLIGVSRDITEQRRLAQELEESRNLFADALAEMSDGLALYDRDGFLIFRNERYTQLAPRTAALRKPGAHIRDILMAVAETGEELGIPANDHAGWVAQTAATLHQQSDHEIQLFDGRWLQLRSRPTHDGKALLMVSDVTTLKESEAALRTLTEQLRQLAATDGLTGIMNRRALDAALGKEIARAVAREAPLSLMIADVDRFKAYNDLYGHPAGDECLRAVSGCLKAVRVRPGDIVARYGGEEFVAVLPDTDEAGALAIAERFRKALMELGLKHEVSEYGVVTASIGVATLGEGTNVIELLANADAALYRAKSNGRNRVSVWRPQPKDAIPGPALTGAV